LAEEVFFQEMPLLLETHSQALQAAPHCLRAL
jgi:hypothetical protein